MLPSFKKNCLFSLFAAIEGIGAGDLAGNSAANNHVISGPMITVQTQSAPKRKNMQSNALASAFSNAWKEGTLATEVAMFSSVSNHITLFSVCVCVWPMKLLGSNFIFAISWEVRLWKVYHNSGVCFFSGRTFLGCWHCNYMHNTMCWLSVSVFMFVVSSWRRCYTLQNAAGKEKRETSSFLGGRHVCRWYSVLSCVGWQKGLKLEKPWL